MALSLFRREREGQSTLPAAQEARGGAQQVGQTEIGEHGLAQRMTRRVMGVKQDIAGFEIPMDHALLMGVIDGGSDGLKEMKQVGKRGEGVPGRGVTRGVGKGGSFNVVHHQIGHGLLRFRGRGDMEAVQPHDVGMLKGKDALRLG